MRPERGGGVALSPMAGAGSRPSLSPWRTPTPYLFLGFAFMMGVITVALLVLICTRRRSSSRQEAAVDDEKASASASARVLVPLDREPRVVVVMAGDHAPSFLACAKPLAVAAPAPPAADQAHRCAAAAV